MTDEVLCRELDTWVIAGADSRRFCLTNRVGLRVIVMEFGATVLEVAWVDSAGAVIPLSRGLAVAQDYAQNVPYMGALCGRFAGRIGHAAFSLGGSTHELSRNSGDHHLHGGVIGFSARRWTATKVDEPGCCGVELTYVSPHGEEGYPGRLQATVRYSLDAHSRLHMEYSASVREESTLVNLTNHSYWNLSHQNHIRDHELQVAAECVLEFDEHQIPTGRETNVAGSPFDFSNKARLGDRMDRIDSGGFDHCYVTHGRATTADIPPRVAQLSDPQSGRRMEVYSDQPALVLYTGNHLDGAQSCGGHQRHAALCIECQQYPDAPNHAQFPTTVLEVGEQYRQHTIYQFFRA